MEWTIQEVARKAGTTSRTLRHYDQIGLLSPSHIGHNGYRYYDATAVVRLQRILLLRELEDMSYAELAVTLGVNEGTVKSRLARARAAALLHYRDYTGAHRDE